jgi:hypothetical protein
MLIVLKTYEVAPGVLTEHGKVSRTPSQVVLCEVMTRTDLKPNRLRIRGPTLMPPLVRQITKTPFLFAKATCEYRMRTLPLRAHRVQGTVTSASNAEHMLIIYLTRTSITL